MSTPLYTATTTLYTEMEIVLKWHLSQTCITQANRGVFYDNYSYCVSIAVCRERTQYEYLV